MGTKQDYYIVEATGAGEGGEDNEGAGGEGEGGDEEPGFEAPGTAGGLNEFSYWVTHDSLSEWTKLPDVKPSELKAAREIKVVFTGELNRVIYTNPFFMQASEKFYLRAQIARIMFNTTCLPRGLFKVEEDDDGKPTREVLAIEPEGEEESVPVPTNAQMAHPAMWVHAMPNILRNCRTKHGDVEEPTGEEAENFDPVEAAAMQEAADPYEPRLKPISMDEKVKVSNKLSQNAWCVRVCGDSEEYSAEDRKST